MVETNTEIKVDEFPSGINLVKETEGDNDEVPKEENFSVCGKDRYEYEEGTDKVTGNKEIEEATHTDYCVRRYRILSMILLRAVFLLILLHRDPKSFKTKMNC